MSYLIKLKDRAPFFFYTRASQQTLFIRSSHSDRGPEVICKAEIHSSVILISLAHHIADGAGNHCGLWCEKATQ